MSTKKSRKSPRYWGRLLLFNDFGLAQFEVSAFSLTHLVVLIFQSVTALAIPPTSIAVNPFRNDLTRRIFYTGILASVLLLTSIAQMGILSTSRSFSFRLCHTNGFLRGRMFASVYKERTLLSSHLTNAMSFIRVFRILCTYIC